MGLDSPYVLDYLKYFSYIFFYRFLCSPVCLFVFIYNNITNSYISVFHAYYDLHFKGTPWDETFSMLSILKIIFI